MKLLVLICIAGAILVWISRDALRASGENDMVSPGLKMALDNCMAAYLLLGAAVLAALTELESEPERRKELFLQSKCSSINQYNKSRETKLKRCIFACDERVGSCSMTESCFRDI